MKVILSVVLFACAVLPARAAIEEFPDAFTPKAAEKPNAEPEKAKEAARQAAEAAEGDEGEEEVVVVRTTKRKLAPQKPPVELPPVPTLEESIDAKRLIHHFCRAWKNEDYKRMYWAMSDEYRGGTSLEKFTKLFVDNKASNGGLDDERIDGDEKLVADGTQLSVTLTWRFPKAPKKSVKAVAVKTKEGYRMRACALIPIDLDDL